MAKWNKCPGCGITTGGTDAYCPKCGESLIITCPGCGASWRFWEDYRFCPRCGSALKRPEAVEAGKG